MRVKMMRGLAVALVMVAAALAAASMVSAQGSSAPAKVVKVVKGKKYCTKGWECTTPSVYCCNYTVSDYFQVYQFENLFPNRNLPIAYAVGFWDYQSFITSTLDYQHLGFGTTGNKTLNMLELTAFLGIVGSRTTCGSALSTGGPLSWGLCYNHEMSPSESYCDEDYKLLYPCAPGAEYYGRGAIPVYWNFNYGMIGEGMKEDLLTHPEYLEQNATTAFRAALYQWMTSSAKGQPSPHDAFVGNWIPTKNDTLENRVPGFGSAMNLLFGKNVCNGGDVEHMNNMISTYLYYTDLMGVGREEAGTNEVLTCVESKPFIPRTSGKKSSAKSSS